MAAQFIVKGCVRHGKDREPLARVKVSVFDKDLRSEQLLGEAVTDADGHYEITYTDEQFRRAEKRNADFVIPFHPQRAFAHTNLSRQCAAHHSIGGGNGTSTTEIGTER